MPTLETEHQKTLELTEQHIQLEISNPLFNYTDLIPFDQIKPHHFIDAFELLIEKIEPQLILIETDPNPSWNTILTPLEAIEEEIHHTVSPMMHLKMVTDSFDIRQACAEIEPLFKNLLLRIKQSKPIFNAYNQIKESAEWDVLSPVQKRILENCLMEAKLSGIGLEGEDKELFNDLTHQLIKLQSTYNSNLLDSIKDFSLIIEDKALLMGLPNHVLQLASQMYNDSKLDKDPVSTPDIGPWKLTLAAPIYHPVMCHCTSREIRKQLYKGQMLKASTGTFDNSENILAQLALRKKIANLLGFDSYAELSLKKKMASDIETVKAFLQELRDASWHVGKKDLEELEAYASASGFIDQLMPWDYSYFEERVKEEKFNLSEDLIKSYFPMSKVLNGLFDLCNTLFEITIEPADFNVSVWHQDVSYYIIKNKDGDQISSFYLDPYSRPQSKRGGAWMDSCRNRHNSGDIKQNPIAYIVCNATPPLEHIPALLSFREVETLFHEFGHALQHMLTIVDFATVSGINGIEWDAVEMVSQFMENWCYHPDTLKKITAHYITHEPLPDHYIDQILASRMFQSGHHMLNQIKYSMIDLALHDQFDPSSDLSPFKFYNDICQYTSHIPCLEEDRFLCSFHHIFGDNAYAAGYYSYKWAEVMSADVFQAFEEVGLENASAIREVGERLKKTFLELGGSLHPMEIFHYFRHRAPSIQALLEKNGFANERRSSLQ